LTAPRAVATLIVSARWGASCPRQGSLSHPSRFDRQLEPSSGL